MLHTLAEWSMHPCAPPPAARRRGGRGRLRERGVGSRACVREPVVHTGGGRSASRASEGGCCTPDYRERGASSIKKGRVLGAHLPAATRSGRRTRRR